MKKGKNGRGYRINSENILLKNKNYYKSKIEILIIIEKMHNAQHHINKMHSTWLISNKNPLINTVVILKITTLASESSNF